jgi:hypothetical protein
MSRNLSNTLEAVKNAKEIAGPIFLPFNVQRFLMLG